MVYKAVLVPRNSLPKSLFTAEGNLYKYTDKPSVADDVFGMQNNIVVDTECHEENGVTFFNGIAVVNIMDIKKQKIKICLIFAKAVLLEKNSCTLVIFDRYTAHL